MSPEIYVYLRFVAAGARGSQLACSDCVLAN
jgi:hypothetical protein